jgi:hypothetical protein
MPAEFPHPPNRPCHPQQGLNLPSLTQEQIPDYLREKKVLLISRTCFPLIHYKLRPVRRAEFADTYYLCHFLSRARFIRGPPVPPPPWSPPSPRKMTGGVSNLSPFVTVAGGRRLCSKISKQRELKRHENMEVRHLALKPNRREEICHSNPPFIMLYIAIRYIHDPSISLVSCSDSLKPI